MDRLDDENIALLTLLYSCKRPDSWKSLTNQCLVEGSARRVLMNRLDAQSNPLREFDEVEPKDFALFPEPLSDARQREYDAAAREAERDYDEWMRAELRFVSIFDSDYPHLLLDSVDAPPFMFSKGLLLSDDRGVSVVGSRHASPQGLEFAQEVAAMLAKRSLTVVAGLAEGVDTAAHQAALDAGARTVAFIGTGINRAYPASNRALQERIAHEGLVLSQFKPDAPPTRQTFPMRNAVMSSYGLASVICDAGEHSGTRIQARQAMQHGRPIIFRQQVVEQTRWAHSYLDKPNVYVARTVNDVARFIDAIFHTALVQVDDDYLRIPLGV